MILCRKRGFLFLRIPKTASTSICSHLIKNIPKEEIDEFWGVDFLPPPRHSYSFKQYQDQNQMPIINWHEKMTTATPHCTKEDLIKLGIIDDRDLKNLKLFAVVRNPIDRFLSIVSMFVFQKTRRRVSDNINDEISFFIEKIENESLTDYEQTFFSQQVNWIDDDVNIIMYPQFSNFLKSISVPVNINQNFRTGNRNNNAQKNNLSEVLRYHIEKIYKEDIVLWNRGTS